MVYGVAMSRHAFPVVFFVAISCALAHAQTDAPFIPAGTHVSVRLEETIRTQTAKAGDVVTAVFDRPLSVGGVVILPSGSRARGHIDAVLAKSEDNVGWCRLVFGDIILPGGHELQKPLFNSFSAKPRRPVLRTIVMAGAGFAAGWLLSSPSTRGGAVIGGVAAGTLISANWSGRQRDLVLNKGTTISLRLGDDLHK